MSVKQYRVVGKTTQMKSILVREGKSFVQKNIRRGVEYTLNENQMSFHIRRQEARKILKVIEIIPEPAAMGVELVEEDSPKKTRRKKG